MTKEEIIAKASQCGWTQTMLKEALAKAENESPPLWAVYVSGMDEWQACENKEKAEQIAKETNDLLASKYEGKEEDHYVTATAKEWPYSPEFHAQDLKKWKAEEAARKSVLEGEL